ncbi:MAG: hypothetical protein ACOC0X_00195 [Halobacteriota archaeon]
MAVAIPEAVLAHFEAFTCYNSPYVAHDDGRAIDLYPGGDRAVSPVAGVVTAVERVRAPPRPYSPPTDGLLVIDPTGAGGPFDRGDGSTPLARLLHLEPSVAVGDAVEVGDDLGGLVRAGFFAPWVPNHLHLGFRPRGADVRRARGSLPLSLAVDLHPVAWDGRGRVVEAGETWVELEAPPGVTDAPEAAWVGVAADDGRPLDGGLPHYRSGGDLWTLQADPATGQEPVHLLGRRVGTLRGRKLAWEDVTIEANGVPITGLSLYWATPQRFRPKLICPGHGFEVGERLEVSITA